MRWPIAAAPLLVLAACSHGAEDNAAEDPAAVPTEIRDAIIDAPSYDIADNDDLTNAQGDGSTTAAVPSGAESGAPGHPGVPAAFIGTWGQGALDCDASTGNDKGVMIVTPGGLEFFESRARLQSAQVVAPTRFRGTFAFTGEGGSWTNDEELALQPGGKSLVRREYGRQAFVGTLTYSRCPHG